MANDIAEITRALSSPLGEFIAAVGRGVAEAQQALDLHTLETFKNVYESGESTYAEFRLLGYQPTWYRIPEVTAEIYVTLSASGREQFESRTPPAAALPANQGRGTARGTTGDVVESTTTADQPGRIQLFATPVDASYSNTYGYDIRACSQLKFRIVPVPPSTQAEGIKVVPKLTDLTYAQAETTLRQLGIDYRLADPYYRPRGSESVQKTEPDAGSILLAGQTLVLTLTKASSPALDAAADR